MTMLFHQRFSEEFRQLLWTQEAITAKSFCQLKKVILSLPARLNKIKQTKKSSESHHNLFHLLILSKIVNRIEIENKTSPQPSLAVVRMVEAFSP